MPNKEIKSNINIASNVYIRTETAEYDDVAFIQQITGYNALLKISSKSQQLNLTYTQEQELKNNIPCNSSNNKLQEQTFGAVKIDNEIVWSCRCENIECENYEDCMNLPNSKRIDRDYINLDGVHNKKNQEVNPNETLFKENQDIQQNLSSKNAETFHFDDTAYNYTKTNDSTKIIQAPINESIIVNVKNGTELIIKRIEYLIGNNLIANLSEILILCYKKSTETTIKNNLFNDITVLTLDAYATKCLHDIGDTKYKTLTYDERIERFNTQITQIDVSKFKLVMLDEMHYLQNQRAMMALHLLKKVHGGMLLVGDKCQALYQNSEPNSMINVETTKLYNLLTKILPRGTKKYEYIINTQNENSLVQIYTNIREALLYKNLIEAKKIIKREFDKIETELTILEKFRPRLKSSETTAFLCKNDSEAEYVSSTLYKNKIPHNLLRSSKNQYSYNRWIADILWDHGGKFLTKEDFLQRYKARVNDDENTAIKMFDLLLNFTSEYNLEQTNNNRILKSDLLTNFTNGKMPPVEFTNKNNCQITVSTIDKSKGEEFDNVYLVNFDIDEISNDQVKLDKLHEIYVALISSKSSVKMINCKNRISFKITENKRSYRTYTKYNEETCTHFSIGDDVAVECFICGNFKQVLNAQRYMSENVRINDKVELILEADEYQIYHVQNTRTSQKITQYLGVMSSEAFADFKATISSYNNGLLPARLYDLYISQIVTIPQNQELEDVSVQFKNSKFIIGVEISGFAKIDWKK